MYEHGLILPVLVLVSWSILVWLAMIATRVSIMRREKAQRTREFATPGREQWIADNYNHLMEQPTIFYAAALAAHAAGQGDAINTGLAWTYVIVRIAHTLIQTTSNIVMWRFYVFIISTLALAVLVVRTLMGMIA